MCKLTKKLTSESYKGYKIAIKKGDKYFSPATGVEYRVGRVRKATTSLAIALFSFLCQEREILRKSGRFYDKNMIGRTGVFRKKTDAEELIRNWRLGSPCSVLVILRMKVGGELYGGSFAMTCPIVAGGYIDSMKEVA